jgi:hypothetical protein
MTQGIQMTPEIQMTLATQMTLETQIWLRNALASTIVTHLRAKALSGLANYLEMVAPALVHVVRIFPIV